VLSDALASWVARLVQRMETPDHWIIYAEVEEGTVRPMLRAARPCTIAKVGNHY